MTRVARTLGAGLKNLGALLAGLALAWLLAELLLALLLPPPLRYLEPQPLHIPDPELGWLVKPNQHSFTIDRPVATDSHGFRSPEPRAAKDTTGLRVLCLGDSQTFGNGTDQAETWPMRLEARLLALLPGRTVEVLNGGAQGYDTAQETGLLARLAPRLEPDVVVIGFYLNDLGELLRRDLPGAVDPLTHQFRRVGAVKRNVPYALIYLVKRSRVVTLVSWQIRQQRARSREDQNGLVLLGNTPPEYERSWQIVAGCLARADSLCRARRARLVVFPVPTGHEFVKEFPREQYRSRLLALADSLGIQTLDPTPVMKAQGGGFKRYFITWDGHINRETHDLIARLLAEGILQRRPA